MPLKHILFFLLLLITVSSHAQKRNTDISIGKIDSIYSHILKEKRKIWIYLPKKSKTITKYPVLYLLDGDGHFHSVTGIIQQLSQVNGNTVLPEMIVVAILNTDRVRDFTPTPAKKEIPFFKNSGGAAKFTAFLQKELIPFIEKKYPASTHRTIAGHSLGGLLAINTLLNQPNLFNAYIAIDPTLTWDDRMILKTAGQLLKTRKLSNKKLYLSMANTMKSGMDTAIVRKDTSISSYHIRSIMEFTDILKKDTSSGLNWKYAYYKNDTHTSVPLISTHDGLRYIFDFYPEPSFSSLMDENYPRDLDSLLTAHYANVSKKLGYKVIPEESVINQMGYSFLKNKYLSNAYSCFKMNIRNYPTSYRVYTSMGDYYSTINDSARAIEFYTKSLSLKENKYSRRKLNDLLNKGRK